MGSIIGNLSLKRLEQKDPISPYFFILCVETLSTIISQAIQAKAICGIKVCHRAPMVSHVLFADDSVIFARATPEETTHIKAILQSYELASSQMINPHKTELSCSRNLPSPRIDELKTLLGVKCSNLLRKEYGRRQRLEEEEEGFIKGKERNAHKICSTIHPNIHYELLLIT